MVRLAAVLLLFGLAPLARAGDVAANPWFEAGREALAAARAEVGPQPKAKNVILFVGDGMGIHGQGTAAGSE